MRCLNIRRSCTWEGPADTLEEHMATCDFALVPCSNSECSDQIERKDLRLHLEKVCIYREHECAFCAEKGTYSYIILDHYSKCPKIPVLCPKQCYQTMNRCDIQKHVDMECRNASIPCKYEKIGCNVKVKRKHLEIHEHDDQLHLRMAVEKTTQLQERVVKLEEDVAKLAVDRSTTSLTQLQSQLQAQQNHFVSSMQAKVASLENSMKASLQAKTELESSVRASIASLEDKHEFLCDVLDLAMISEFTITEYSKKCWDNEAYISPEFYSMDSEDAYNLAIKIETNGDVDDRGTHISAYVMVKTGKYDADISWPFIGKVTLTLMNQQENKNHHSVTITMDATQNLHPGDNFGYSQYISLAELACCDDKGNTQYLKDDKLRFRVYMSS